MSLLKKQGANKSKRSSIDGELVGSSFAENTNKSHASPLFRKSASVDPPSSSGEERPPSQQSKRGGGGKKKMIPAFLSNLFGNKISEGEPPPETNLSGKKSKSRESVNSVLSSSSFSYVNPKNLGGKQKKGKRVPVDDPNYGVVASSNSKHNEGKKTLGTIDKIGIKIGLKKKYNLQSCESLQYIDACDEPPAVVSAGESSSTRPSVSANQHNPSAEPTAPLSELNTNATIESELSAECQVITKHFSNNESTNSGSSASQLPVTTTASPLQDVPQSEQTTLSTTTPLLTSSPSVSKAELAEYNLRNVKVIKSSAKANFFDKKTELESTTTTSADVDKLPEASKPEQTPSSLASVEVSTSTSPITSPTIVPKSLDPSLSQNNSASVTPKEQIEVKQTSKPPLPFTQSYLIASSTPPTEPKHSVITPPSSKAASSVPEPVVYSVASSATPPESKNSVCSSNVTSSAPSAVIQPVSSTHDTPSEPIACTSSNFTPFAKATPSSYKMSVGASNTWSNSAKRKRRAPPPPSTGRKSSQKFSNGTSSTSHGVVTDIPNDVPSSSSQVAALTKFTRINESPVRSTGTFEIRPRKKERSVEASFPTSRPISFVAGNSNSLFSHRHQHHKRSNSDSYNTGTRGRVHKPGKKKAPPPPNPFGDPDQPEEVEIRVEQPTTPITEPNRDDIQQASTSASTSTVVATVEVLPPTNPKENERPPVAKVNPPTTTSVQQAQRQLEVSVTTATGVNSSNNTSDNPSRTLSSAVPSSEVSTPSVIISSSTSNTVAVVASVPESSQLEPTPPNEYSLEELEEIRQNELNDEQERQQLGLLQADGQLPTTTSSDIPVPVATFSSTSDRQTRHSQPSTSSASVLQETDIEDARRALEVLSASASHSKSEVDPNAKQKLLELKQEAEKSPLNAKKSKSRPTSMGSSIYENPLSLLFGRTSNSNSAAESSAENSPRVTPKPWYKRSAVAKLTSPKSKSSVKPFTSLVKFSDLDKEAAKIVEENRRKSAEQRFNENAQELIALFTSSFPEPSTATNNTSGHEGSGESTASLRVNGQQGPSSPSPVKVSTTTAQIHSIAEETDSRSAISQINNNTTTNEGAAGPASSSNSNNGSSSPPTFQSVHAASKHRQIKPLLTSSPITNIRSEKLAIVQPQTNSSTINREGESSALHNSSRITEESTVPQSTTTTLSTTTTTSTPSASSPARNSTPVVSSDNTPFTSQPQVSSSISAPATTTSQTIASTTSATTTSPPSTTARSTNDPHWDCPRCTLKNPNWRMLCEVCFHRKDSSSSGNSFMSSIFQRVNAESSKTTTSGSTTTTSTVSQASRRLSLLSPAPSFVIATSASSNNNSTPMIVTSSTTSSTLSTIQLSDQRPSSSSPQDQTPTAASDIPSSPPPSCENFLSQLPAKQDIAKEEKLQGIKLHHDDPDLEELDIGKLREARLAYFQEQHKLKKNVGTSTSLSTTSSSCPNESTKEAQAVKTNDLGSCANQQNQTQSRDEKEKHQQITSGNDSTSIKVETPMQTHLPNQTTFTDDEDDFIDYMLELNKSNENTTTVANITNNSLPRPSMSAMQSSSVSPTPTTLQPVVASIAPPTCNSPLMLFQNRYRPRLAAIREGNSQDYTYCYSSSEIAQIYENWQANQQPSCNGNLISNKNLASLPTPLPHQTHLLAPQQASTQFHHFHQQPGSSTTVLSSNNIYPVPYNTATHLVPIVPLDHQPFSNNRHSDSPEENYMNTPTLHDTANFSCAPATPSPIRFPLNVNESSANNGNNNNKSNCGFMMSRGGDRNQQQSHFRYGESSSSSNHNYENNNMSLTPGSSRRLTYEDYRRMGAIPKGYQFSSRNDDWSSESSCDTDSSRGFWGRDGYQDYLHGMTRRGTLDFPQSQDSSNGFADPASAVTKLMKRLEAAIANGDHRLAATLAHDMALMKANCVVAKINQPFSIRIYVEDRFMQQGPFIVQASSMMTVGELKAKIESDWGIPSGFQKWILGRKMAEDDNHSLSSFEMTQDSMAFLFLVTPEIGNVRPGVIVPNDSSNNNKANNFSLPVSEEPGRSNTTNGIIIGNNVPSDTSRKSFNSSSQVNQMPTYNNVSDEGNNTPHFYNHFYSEIDTPADSQLSGGELTKKPDSPGILIADKNATSSTSPPPAVASSSKASSSVQTNHSMVSQNPVTALVSIQNKKTEKENSPPPPLPCRSPIQQLNKEKVVQKSPKPSNSHSVTPERSSNSSNSGSLKSSQKNVKQQACNKAGQKQTIQNQPQVTSETMSAASALTASLQQRLAEFKAVAEQTFGKATVAASRQSPSRSVKEASPKIINGHTDSSERKSDLKEAKPAARRSVKIELTPSSSTSKERLSLSASGSTEKLANKAEESKSDSKIENRFNGKLLPTSKDGENLKPPERSDKANKDKNEVVTPKQRSSKPSNNPDPVKADEVTSENNKIIDNSKKPPIAPTAASQRKQQEVATSSSSAIVTENIKKPEETPVNPTANETKDNPTPQPKPRGLKKQQSVEKQNQGQGGDALLTTPQAPKPVPRTLTSKAGSSGAQRESLSPGPVDPHSNTARSEASVGSTPGMTHEGLHKATTDDCCQTTLPFPAAKSRTSGIANIPSSSGNFPTSPDPQLLNTSSATENDSGKGLLRPSAFVTQTSSNKVNEGTSTSSSGSVLLSIINANSSPITPVSAPQSKPLPSSPILSSSITNTPTPIVAHVQPLPSTKPVNTTPTAYVSPSPSSSSTSTSTTNQTEKKEDNPQSYLKMLELMEKQDLIFTTEDAECPVCFAPLQSGEGIVLRDCLHTFCKECLVGCVQYADDSTVKCPFRDSSYACNNNLQEREIKALVPPEVFEKYLARSVKLAESKIVNTFHCKTPDCTGWCVFEDDVNVFLCPVCKIRNCLTCAAIHEGKDCLEYQRELAIIAETDENAKQSRLMLEKMIQRGEALECPACHVVLLKKWGCDWVRCSYCKTEICWVTKGFRWGKGGKGDVSGGCRCGVNGVKCHPKCTYCH